jgi:hypothetical protein
MTIMEKNAAEYGLTDLQPDTPVEHDTVALDAATSFQLLSDITETPVSELAALNPAVLGTVAPEGFAVNVPKGIGNSLLAALQLIPASRRDSWRLHRVGAGETLAAIGKRYSAAPSGITSANNLASAEPAEGDLLVIPAAYRPSASAKPKAAGARPAARKNSSAARKGSATTARAASAKTPSTTASTRKAIVRRAASKKPAAIKSASSATGKPAVILASSTR